ncbi:TRAP transporter small permease [Sulfitobacter pseudonitzschiae]|nr:TRAP transporter small permease [Pseudosulfitobacter pseudonitzschiae]MBM1815076.1 TRAP transporter small permease [Pseudosulfitobacter pseudonitzschiae]MBM1832067.1 TRAP transporter small permease [Pseudosulfitobacter pseudonitzschiae]MBM1836935.1 TRAP transporter small permease [Pseudosulfitobacter pseudonitzschiae]MBM1841781.1 TRAP transporter small permease [Pseudosulfitobacter pseudonitzschiae]MBM1846649.1 TRAP transporter small permease [Pseudosulfitobacter pseudonitzschiae]
MQENSLWLGRMRAPVKTAMIGFVVLTVVIYALLIGQRLFLENAYGMYEMIRPTGRPLVQAMLVCLVAALLFASLFLSDTKGAIETRPEGFFDLVSVVLGRLAMIMTAFVVLVMFYEVVSRYVFARPTLWANELSLWIAAIVFLLAGLYAMQQRSHIRIYIIYNMMPRWAQKAADSFSVLLIVGFAFALVWGGYSDAAKRFLRMETFGTAWDPPIPGTIKPAVLLIIVLVAIQAVSNLIADWHKDPEEHTPMDEIDETEIENIRRTLKED